MRVTAVIGANFGDEGKGAMVDYVVSRAGGDCVVVRHSGGAQAGHTVVTPSGQRHVFHHFASGSFLDAPTYLSRFFIVNPLVWRLERDELRELGLGPLVYVSPHAPMTTPYDVLINQEVERLRDSDRHGSCGLGIHETLVRSEAIPVGVDSPSLRLLCERIRREWVPQRMAQLTSREPSAQFYDRLHSEEVLSGYLEAVSEFRDETLVTSRIPERECVVFEGAQGLLLDEDHHFFPYVTHSKTGLTNVRTLCSENGIGHIDAVYVTRAYMTRHGAGPFPTENPNLSYPDPTNEPNEFQGTLRFGDLDPVGLRDAIASDLVPRGPQSTTVRVALTCLDQVPEPDGTYSLLRPLVPVGFLSYGPRRCDVIEVEDSSSLEVGCV